MAKFLLVSDFHDDRNGAWSWLSAKSTYAKLKGISGVLYGGDWIGRVTKARPAAQQVREAQQYLANFNAAPWIATPSGNHDWREEMSNAGSSAWLNEMAVYPHIKTHGIHKLPDDWLLEVCDWLEEPQGGEAEGPNTILLTHNGPEGPTTTTKHGICRGDFWLAEKIKRSSWTIIAHGHEHQPRKHMHRQAHALVLNPGVSEFPGEVNHIIIDTGANRCEFYGDGGKFEVTRIYV